MSWGELGRASTTRHVPRDWETASSVLRGWGVAWVGVKGFDSSGAGGTMVHVTGVDIGYG